MASRFLVPFGGRGLSARGDPFVSLQHEMNRMFDDVFRSFGGEQGSGSGAARSVPQLDVHESDSEFCVTADLPGVPESDIDLRIEGDVLTISGEKKQERERDEQGYRMMERSSGSFYRAIRLPFEPDPGKVTADCSNGVVTIHVPKEGQQQRSKRIEIRGGGGQAGQKTIEGQSRAANDPQEQVRQQAAEQAHSGQAGGSAETSGTQRQAGETGQGTSGGGI
ncbi:MAG: Hsp20/alpha crystallin family protein [Novosphingobium sp.]|nr:Hsp20/alpha crystallin family protein [Novosphingobium sp.]